MTRHWPAVFARLVILGGLLVGASAGVAQEATPVGSTDGISVTASGLDNPRGFIWGADGTLYVTQASVAASTTSTDATPAQVSSEYTGGLHGSVARIDSDGCPVVFQGNLPSAGGTGGPDLGPSYLAILDGQMYVLDEGGGASHGNPLTPDGIYAIDGGGSARLVADIGAWVQANPVANPPENLDPDGDPTAMVASAGAFWVVESNSGQLLKVTPDGTITRVADLSEGNLAPHGLAAAPDGSFYVGFLTAPPYPEGDAKVVNITEDGTVTDAWTGLTAVTDVAVGPGGTLYALQTGSGTGDAPWSFAPHTGKVVRQTGPDSSADVAVNLDVPIAMEFGPDQGLYVSSPAIGADRATGSIVRLDINQGHVMTMSDDPLADSPCVSAPTPTATASPAGSPTVSPGTPSADTPTPASEVSVEIKDFAFNPATLTIAAGTTVTWTNNDTTAHTVTAADGSFDSGNLAPGDSFSFTFEDAGTFDYVCSYHPNMQGSVEVEAGAAPSAASPAPPDGTPAPADDDGGAPSEVSVEIKDFAFNPETLSVAPGTTVTWTNNDTTAHTVTAADGSFDSGNLAPGDSFSFTFEDAGSFDYACMYHPNMTASVDVQ